MKASLAAFLKITVSVIWTNDWYLFCFPNRYVECYSRSLVYVELSSRWQLKQ